MTVVLALALGLPAALTLAEWLPAETMVAARASPARTCLILMPRPLDGLARWQTHPGGKNYVEIGNQIGEGGGLSSYRGRVRQQPAAVAPPASATRRLGVD